jgi:hypothetical protein
MRATKQSFHLLASSLVAALSSTAAWAQEPPAEALPPPTPPPVVLQPIPQDAPLPSNVTAGPDGSVSVTGTPAQSVDVHVRTEDSAVHAYGCHRVDVDPGADVKGPVVTAPGPCPLAHPPPYAAPPGAYGYAYPPPPPPDFGRKKRQRWAPDPARKGALIASSIIFGVGTAASGTAYLFSFIPDCSFGGCGPSRGSKPALYAMGSFLTITPSVPRFVVGDWGYGILWTALRGGSFAAGTLIDFKDKSYLLPLTLAFITPLTLGIVDLATTPHREQIEARNRQAANGWQLQGIGPTVAYDSRNNPIPALGALGTF